MKVLLLNLSPHSNGNTNIALNEMEQIFMEEGVQAEIIQIGNKDIRHACSVQPILEQYSWKRGWRRGSGYRRTTDYENFGEKYDIPDEKH